MNRRSFLGLFGKTAVAGGILALSGTEITVLDTAEQAEMARQAGATTITPINADGTGPVLIQHLFNVRTSLQMQFPVGHELYRVDGFYLNPTGDPDLFTLTVIGVPRDDSQSS